MIEWKRATDQDDTPCVEVKVKANQVRIRSSDFLQAELGFSHQQWSDFIKMVKAGEFDL